MDCLPDAVAKVEVETGKASLWLSRLGVVSEPIFVPRPGSGAAQAEDDGWVAESMRFKMACAGANAPWNVGGRW